MIKLPAKFLDPFAGYLDLGMYNEANDELERLPMKLKNHPAVLGARLDLLMEMKRWEDAAIVGGSLAKLWPETLQFHVRTAFCSTR